MISGRRKQPPYWILLWQATCEFVIQSSWHSSFLSCIANFSKLIACVKNVCWLLKSVSSSMLRCCHLCHLCSRQTDEKSWKGTISIFWLIYTEKVVLSRIAVNQIFFRPLFLSHESNMQPKFSFTPFLIWFSYCAVFSMKGSTLLA